MATLTACLVMAPWLGSGSVKAQQLLVPMDRSQANHLKAYGVTFSALEAGATGEWLLNFRGGSFLLPDVPAIRRDAALRGVSVEPVSPAALTGIRARMEEGNMEAVILETVPRIAIYTPPNTPPWDDAVTMALSYAGIPYETVWDEEVLQGRLVDFDWLHLHHEDFTGQYSKFFTTYSGSVWFREEVERNEAVASAFGFPNVPQLKGAVAREIRAYVEQGGFLFAMCSATETLDLALAGEGISFAAAFSAGAPPDPDASAKMDWSKAMAFQDAALALSPSVNAFSDVDGHQVNTPHRRPLGAFRLFDFSAQFDPVPSMLTQNHEAVIPDFYGLTTSFREDRIRPGVAILAQDGELVKYVHGSLGEGTFTFLGGHDPEDPEHQIGDAPTDLDLHPNSPGYRLILNNVLFPAARKEPLKT